MERNVNVIVAFYMGEKRVKQVSDPEMFIHRHLQSFRDNDMQDIGRVTLVLNTYSFEETARFQEVVDEYRPYYTDLKVIIRPNFGFSYSAWNDAINRSLESGDEFTHYMLLEDDYIITQKDSLEVFASQMTGNIGYVCQKLSDPTLGRLFGTQKHPGIACGLLSAEAARQAYANHGSALQTVSHETGRYDWFSLQMQVHFTDYILQDGWDITDVSKVSSVPFVHQNMYNERGFFIMEYGRPEFPRHIEPVVEWSMFPK